MGAESVEEGVEAELELARRRTVRGGRSGHGRGVRAGVLLGDSPRAAPSLRPGGAPRLRALRDVLTSHESEFQDALKAHLGRRPAEAFVTEIGFIVNEIDRTLSHLTAWRRPRRRGEGRAARGPRRPPRRPAPGRRLMAPQHGPRRAQIAFSDSAAKQLENLWAGADEDPAAQIAYALNTRGQSRRTTEKGERPARSKG